MANHENLQDDGAGPIPSQTPSNERTRVELPTGLQAGLGLAVSSFVLGLISLPFALFVIGLIPGLIGLVLAIVHLRKKRIYRAMATWGLVLSSLGCLASAGLGTYYGISIYTAYKKYTAYKLMNKMDFGEPDHMFDKFIGTESPDFTMTDIQGNETKLSDLKGKCVILDFWATWCPPCIKEIPHFIELRKETEPDKLTIIGISDENIEKLRDFSAEKKINYTIATADDLPAPYSDIVSIPTTFFIDSKGIIQRVLTGYHSLDALKHSLDALKENALAHKHKELINSKLPRLPSHSERGPSLQEMEEIEKLGQLPKDVTPGVLLGKDFISKKLFLEDSRLGSVTSIVFGELDPSKGLEIGIAGTKGALFTDTSSKVKSLVQFSSKPSHIDIVDVDADGICEFLDPGSWSGDTCLISHKGNVIWSYGGGRPGVNDTCFGDIDEDGLMEFVVGFNGGGGVHLLDENGKKEWEQPDGNVWHVELADTNQDGKLEIIHSNAGGKMTIRNRNGNIISRVKPAIYFSGFSICSWPTKNDQKYALVADKDRLIILGFNGTVVAQFEAPRINTFGEAIGKPVRIISNQDEYFVVLVSYRNHSILYIYNSMKGLEYQEIIPETSKSLATISLPGSQTEIILVGGNGKVWQYEVIGLLPKDTSDELMDDYEARLKLYQSGKPYIRDKLGLTGWWKFDETEGSIAADSYAENNGTVHGAQWTAGQVGGALDFNGTDDYVGLGYIGDFAALTISVWVNIDSLPNIFSSLLHNDGWSSGDVHFMILNDGCVRFSVNGSPIRDLKSINEKMSKGLPSSIVDQDSSYSFTTDDFGEWHHIAAVYDSSNRTVDFYIDGQLDVQRSYSSTGTVTVGPLRIGGWDSQGGPSSERYFDGRIDDVRIYNYALSRDELAAIYAGKEPDRAED